MNEGYIYVGGNIFSTLLAISSDEQEKGLMEQDWPPPIMTFVYPESRINKFWMKNTPSPLDIVFCSNGEVSEICYGEPLSTKVIGSDSHSDLVIEFPHGTVISSKIKLGDKVSLVRPTPNELLKIFAERRR